MIILHMVGNVKDFGFYLTVYRELWEFFNQVKGRFDFLFKKVNNSGSSVVLVQEWSVTSR